MSQFINFFNEYEVPENKPSQSEEVDDKKRKNIESVECVEVSKPKKSEQRKEKAESEKLQIDAKVYEAVFIREYLIDNDSNETLHLSLILES